GCAGRADARVLLGLRFDSGRDRAQAVVPVLATARSAVEAALSPAERGLPRRYARRGRRWRHRAVPSSLWAAAGPQRRDPDAGWHRWRAITGSARAAFANQRARARGVGARTTDPGRRGNARASRWFPRPSGRALPSLLGPSDRRRGRDRLRT